MRNPLYRKSAFVSEHPGGAVRVDTCMKKLTKRLQPGGIATIDHAGLDQVAAEALVGYGVSAVLNASPSISGYYPNLGPGILLDARIPLVDDLGPDIMRLHDGQRVIVEDGSVRVEGKEQIITEGSVQAKQTVVEAMDEAQKGLSVQLETFAVNTMEYIRGEWDLLLGGVNMPSLATQTSNKHVLVVVRGHSYKEDLQTLKPYTREYKPVIIGVDGGADAVPDAGFKPTLIVGGIDSVSNKALTCSAEIAVHAYHDGRAPDLTHVEKLGVEHHAFAAANTDEDVAMLMADEAGAEIIMTLGTHAILLEFLGKERAGMSLTFLTRLKVSGRFIDAKGVSRLYRTRILRWWLLFLALVDIFTLAIALISTPDGQTSLGLSGVVWDDVINLFCSLLGPAPNSPTV